MRTRRTWAWRIAAVLTVLAGIGALAATRAPAAASPAPLGAPRILTGPTSPTSSSTATFTFDFPGATVLFQCSLDGESFRRCTSPQTYRDLSSRQHTFRVAAQFTSTGALGTATSRTWTVDRTAPQVAVTFPPADAVVTRNQWTAGCTPRGICGTAADASGVTRVRVAVQNIGTSRWWNGSAFNAPSSTFFDATGTTNWVLGLSIPPDGKYRLSVVATDTLGNNSDPLTRSFRIDATPPLPPSITLKPASETTSTSATFRFTVFADPKQQGESDDDHKGVTALCSLDDQAFAPCTSPKSYTSLLPGPHCFRVLAQDAVGNRSTPTPYCWSITVNTSFLFSGDATTAIGPDAPAFIDVRVNNPYGFPLKLLTFGATLHTEQPGCPDDNFRVVVPSPSQLALLASVPINTTGSFGTLGPPGASQWVRVEMVETGLVQNACLGARITLTYTGTGTQG